MPLPTRLLVLLNPFSGPGDALTIYQKRVVPMFAQARLDFHLIITERAGHARELVKEIKLEEWQGIVIVSGDGLIFEVVNGLMERNDWEKAIKMPLGAIPGGSGNALACAICYLAGEPYLEKHAMHASFIISKHDVVPMDLVAVDTCNGERLYSFLSVGWGMIADVDIESEKYRNIGNARFAFMAIIKIASMKKYRGRLSFLPADRNYVSRAGSGSMESYTQRRNSATHVGDAENDTIDSGQKPVHNKHSYINGDSSLKCKSVLSPLLPPLDQPVPVGWVTIEDEFILVGGIYQSHLAKDNLMTPEATLDDGLIHLVFVRGDCSRVNLIRLFAALEGGLEVRDNDYCTEVVKVLGFRLEPHGTKGLMTVDGERVEYGPIQAQVLPSMAQVMSIKHKD